MAIILCLTALITAAVIFRYLLNMPIVGSDELAGYMFVAITMLGLAFTFEKKSHIRIEILTIKLPSRLQKILRIIVGLLSIFALVWLIVTTFSLALDSYRLKSISLSGLDIPIAIPQFLLPLGLFILLLVILKYLFSQIIIILGYSIDEESHKIE